MTPSSQLGPSDENLNEASSTASREEAEDTPFRRSSPGPTSEAGVIFADRDDNGVNRGESHSAEDAHGNGVNSQSDPSGEDAAPLNNDNLASRDDSGENWGVASLSAHGAGGSGDFDFPEYSFNSLIGNHGDETIANANSSCLETTPMPPLPSSKNYNDEKDEKAEGEVFVAKLLIDPQADKNDETADDGTNPSEISDHSRNASAANDDSLPAMTEDWFRPNEELHQDMARDPLGTDRQLRNRRLAMGREGQGIGIILNNACAHENSKEVNGFTNTKRNNKEPSRKKKRNASSSDFDSGKDEASLDSGDRVAKRGSKRSIDSTEDTGNRTPRYNKTGRKKYKCGKCGKPLKNNPNGGPHECDVQQYTETVVRTLFFYAYQMGFVHGRNSQPQQHDSNTCEEETKETSENEKLD